MGAKDWFIGLPQGKDNIFELTREQILKLLDDYAGEVVKNLNIPTVINRRELLIDFIKYINSNGADILKDVIDDDSVDEYLKSINSL